jgi:DNA-binding CsgD family transcriptional regulator
VPIAAKEARSRGELLLEREAELEAVDDVLRATRDGRGAVVLVEAVAGLGKSRLLRAAIDRARELQLETLAGCGSELESSFPFGVVLQLFERRLRDVRAAERRRLLAGAAALAGPLLGSGAARQPDPGEGDFAVLHGLYWLAANLAEDRPLVLCVDDAHWADPLSLRYLVYLANRIAELPIAMLATTRPPTGAQAALVRELGGHAATRALALDPLTLDGVSRLLDRRGLAGSSADPSFVRACADVTRGNPLFVRELGNALIAAGATPGEDGAALAREIGPEPVSRTVSVSLARLPRAATSLARALAVLGDDADPAVAAALARLEPDEATSAAADLAVADVFERSPKLRFVHPIVRAALYEELAPQERAVAHRRAARLLRDSGAAPERIAAHLVQTGPAGERWAVDALRESARVAAERGAPAIAAAQLERALAEAAGDRRELLVELARAQASGGEPSARASYEQAIELSSDRRERARLFAELGRALYLQSRFGESVEAFDLGIHALDDPGDPDALSLAAGRSAALLWAPGIGADPYAQLESLLDRARGAATVAERAVLANLSAAAMLRAGDRERALKLARLAWSDGALLEEGASAVTPSVLAITAVFNQGEHEDRTLEVAEAMLADARRRGLLFSFATFSYVRGYSMLMLGKVADAIADAEQALAARAYGWQLFLPAALWVFTVASIERGELESAAAAIEAVEDGEEQLPTFGALPLARGELALAQGDYRAAVGHLSRGTDLIAAEIGGDDPGVFRSHASLSVALAGAGEREAAIRAADENLARARRWGAPRTLALGLRARGLAEGGARAVPWLEQAVAAVADTPSRLVHAQVLTDLGGALRTAGERIAARETLRVALDTAHGCGGARLAARAREELVAVGGRPRRERVSGVEGLTPGERRVADMTASGMTNRQIAEALFVTLKAVEYHLANVYRKLDVKRRGELAAALTSPLS